MWWCALGSQQRISLRCSPETCESRSFEFSALLSQLQPGRLESDSKDVRLLSSARAACPEHQHQSQQYSMSSVAHEPTEVTSPQRPGIRRGPRVSNACVNCRRRKVRFAVVCDDSCRVDVDVSCRLNAQARSRGASTAPRTRSTASTRNSSNGRGKQAVVESRHVLRALTRMAP